MTSPLAVIGLTYDSEDLQVFADGILIDQVLRGINEAPSVRGADYTVPHLDGQIEMPRRVHRLDIVLGGRVWGVATEPATEAELRSSFRTNVRMMRELFYPSRSSANLVAVLEDGSTWTIAARPADSTPPLLWGQEMPSYASVSIALFSVVPEWTIEEAP